MVKGGGSTTTSNELPPELRSLAQSSSARIQELQGAFPLSEFIRGDAFQTAGRANQFGQAQGEISRSAGITQSPLGSRSQLNVRPGGTNRASAIAEGAHREAGSVPSAFSNLIPAARTPVGLQELERRAVLRANATPEVVGQTPGEFGATLGRFQQGIDPLQQLAGGVPGQFDQTRNQFLQGVNPLQQLAGQVPGTFGDVRAQADPGIADLIGLADQRVTGENLQQSPAFQAALDAFESTIMPTIQNSAALSGLGRSTGLQQSLAAGQAQYMLPVIQEELAREERALGRGLGARQFGIQTAADLGLQEALAQERGIGREADMGRFGLATAADLGLQSALAEERGIQRGVDVGQFGLATEADLGLQEAMARERGLERFGQSRQFAAGLEADTGRQLAGRREDQINRQLAAIQEVGLAGERGLQRRQNAAQFRTGVEQAAGQQDLQRVLEGLGADERSRAIRFQQSQSAIPQLIQLGQLEQDFQQGALDREAQDFLRRQALSESAVFQPFGQIAPSTIGQRSSTSGKKGK